MDVRPIQSDELEAWVRVLHTAFHGDHSQADEVAWRREAAGEPNPRTLGAFDGARLVGTLATFETPLTLPGGRQVPSDAITSASVMPTHRRRGVLSGLLGSDLRAGRERGEVASVLIASEYPIYGHFGYGPATEHATYELDVQRARFVRQAPGTLELVEPEQMRELARPIFETVRCTTPGQIERAPFRWDAQLGVRETPWSSRPPDRCLLYRDPAGQPQGYALYRAQGIWEHRVPQGVLEVAELMALTADAYLGLWRFCAEVDLISRVRARSRPVREPLAWLLADARAAWRQLERADFLWLRPLDVAALLDARAYAHEGEVVLEVVDRLGLCGGRYALAVEDGGAATKATTRSADVTLGTDALGHLVLGGGSLRDLLAAGRVDEHTPGEVERVDGMFWSAVVPWCSTFF